MQELLRLSNCFGMLGVLFGVGLHIARKLAAEPKLPLYRISKIVDSRYRFAIKEHTKTGQGLTTIGRQFMWQQSKVWM